MTGTSFESLDDVQTAILSELMANGAEVAPRGVHTLESRFVSFTLTSPRRRCILNPPRRWSFPLALGELCWHLSASTEAAALAYYAPIWSSIADDDGQIRGSCYGSKIFSNGQGTSPWLKLKELLRIDPASRRAVLHFNDLVSHLNPVCRDAACALSLQFLIRDGSLDAIVYMRSNDVIWGLPYDVFLFTFLQELLAAELNIGLGSYHHIAASMHIYSRHLPLAKKILAWPGTSSFEMPALFSAESVTSLPRFEKAARTGASPLMPCLDTYCEGLVAVLRAYRASRDVGWAASLDKLPIDFPYRSVLEPLSEP